MSATLLQMVHSKPDGTVRRRLSSIHTL